jgi:hypothetical protein
MKKLQVSLPDDLREQLDVVVAKSGNSLGEEIRQRLERTIEQDALDPVTRELLTGIADLAAGVQADLGTPWHAYGEVLNVFAAAVAQHLADYKPLSPGEFGDLFRDMGFGRPAASQLKEAPDVLGATIARANQRMHSYEYLQRLQAARPTIKPGSGLLKKEEGLSHMRKRLQAARQRKPKKE